MARLQQEPRAERRARVPESPPQAGPAPSLVQPQEQQARSHGCVGRERSVGLPHGRAPDGPAQRA